MPIANEVRQGGGSFAVRNSTVVWWRARRASAPPMNVVSDRNSFAASSAHRIDWSNQNRDMMPVSTIESWITSAITRMARNAWSTRFNAARTRSATGPRRITDFAGWAAASSPSKGGESGSCMPDFLQDRAIKVGTDDVLELRIDGLGRLAIGVAVRLDNGLLGLVAGQDFIALGGDRGAPVLGEIGAGSADGVLRILWQRVELRLARHHDADVVDLIGQVDRVDDLVMLGGGQRNHRRFDGVDDALGQREIDLGEVDRDRARAQ